MMYNTDSSEEINDSTIENIVSLGSRVNSPTSLNRVFNNVSLNPRVSCLLLEIYVNEECNLED